MSPFPAHFVKLFMRRMFTVMIAWFKLPTQGWNSLFFVMYFHHQKIDNAMMDKISVLKFKFDVDINIKFNAGL